MTKSNRNLLIGAAVVVGAIYLYKKSKPVASDDETSSFLGFGRKRRIVRAGGGGKTDCSGYSPCSQGLVRCPAYGCRCARPTDCGYASKSTR